ncbi:MAG: hypothetical protein RR362_02665 [Raoultibacter sp.]
MSPLPSSTPGALVIDRLTVAADRVICEVRVDPRYASTTPELSCRMQRAFPDIASHTCVNECGDTFGAVIDHTSLPHLLEHVVIDAQTRASTDPRTIFVGTTRWLDKMHTKARVEVSFTDDLVALRAFLDSAEFLNREVIK